MFSIFKGKPAANEAAETLQKSGFSEDNVTVVLPRVGGSKDFQVETWHQKGYTPLSGAVVGAVVGFVLSLGINFFVTYNASLIGPYAVSAFCTIFGALFGAISFFLVRIGTPDPLAKRYLHYMDDGGVLVAVRNLDEPNSKRAIGILEGLGAAEVHAVSNEQKIWQGVFRKSEDRANFKRRSGRARFMNHPSHP